MSAFRKGQKVRVVGGRHAGRPALVPGQLRGGYVSLSFLDADWDSPPYGAIPDNLEFERANNG